MTTEYIPAFPKPKQAAKRKGFKPEGAVEVIPDATNPRGFREVCNKNQAGRAEYKRRRVVAWEKYGGICQICFRRVAHPDTPNVPYLLQCTSDHITPRGIGGSTRDDHVDNLQPAHRMCNTEKGSRRGWTKTKKT